MKIELSKKELLIGLKKLKSSVVKTNSVIFIEVDETVSFYAGITSIVRFKPQYFNIINKGYATIEYDIFVNIVNKFKGGDNIILELIENVLHIKLDNKKATLQNDVNNCFDDIVSRFKNTSALENIINSFTISSNVLYKYFNKSKSFVATDNVRPIFQGIRLKQCDNTLDIVALDGCRISCLTTSDFKGENIDIVIDSYTFKEFLKLKVKNETATIGYTKSHTVLEVGEYTFISKILEGEPFNYINIFNHSHLTNFNINTKNFKETNAMFNNKDKQLSIAKYEINKDNLKISSKNDKFTLEDIVNIDNFTGNDIEIGFNTNFFSDILNVIEDEKINISLCDNLSPTIIKADNEKYLILPVRLRTIK